MKRILAMAAHPDDMEIGCAGTLAAYAARGAETYLFVATTGDVGGQAEGRMGEQEASAKLLGIRRVFWGGFPDTHLPDHANALLAKLEDVMHQVDPDLVLVNHCQDTHQDHRTLGEVANSVTRYVPNVLAYETPSSAGFEPTVFMDIHETLALKLKALEAHASQVDRTHMRLSIVDIALATAHFRGVQGKLNCAEAFMPVRVRL
jgi:LmbE family N-acetylglucosaminyl deacetylase